jgi:hypothetical protein
MNHDGTKDTKEEREKMPNATPLRALRVFVVSASTQSRNGAEPT